jgi:hypothetical protein
LRGLICAVLALPSLAHADLGARFEALMTQSAANLKLNVERINARLADNAQLNTAALNLEGNVTTADRLAAAVSTTVAGVESGLAVDLVGLAAGRKMPHSVVLTLGKLADDGVRSGIAYAFEYTPPTSVGDYCPVEARPKSKKSPSNADLRARFVELCTAVQADTSGSKRARIARVVCGFESDPNRPVETQNMTWAGINLGAWAEKAKKPGLAKKARPLEEAHLLVTCTDKQAAANLKRLRNAHARHAVGIGLMTDWFPIRAGTQLEDEQAERSGSPLEPYENFKSGALLLEGRHGTTLWQITYGASLRTFRLAPREPDRTTTIAPRLSGEIALASLGKIKRASLGPNDARMALGLDLSAAAQLSEDEEDAPDVGPWRTISATLRLDTTVNTKVKVRLALPITWNRLVIPEDMDNPETIGWAFTIPASIITVMKF